MACAVVLWCGFWLPVAAGAQTALAAAPAGLTLAPGQRAQVVVRGASGALSAMASAPPVSVDVASGSSTLIVTARALGSAIVHVSDAAGAAVDVPVDVVPPAGSIPERLRLTLTGDPASPGFIAGQIAAAITAAIRPALGAGSSIIAGAPLPAVQQLDSGFLTGFTVPIEIRPSPGTAAVSGATVVDVVNRTLTGFRPLTLAFADDPERISADGVLSRTTVSAEHPARIYYYHENMGVRRRFCVVLSANASVLSHVQIVGAAAGPNIDVMSVGHAVSKTFLDVQPHDEGVVLPIAGGKPILERDTLAGPGEVIVGALDVRVLDGGPVTATVLAIPPGAAPADFLYGPQLPDDGHARHGIFALTGFAERIIAFSAGRDVGYTYGNRQRTLANAEPGDSGHDYGDYGVLQRIAFDLANPGTAPARLYLYEKPLGGVVRSSFVVNGTLTDLGCARVPQRYLIASLVLGPHATGVFDVLTMTDGGSNYPLEIGVSATPPLAETPAMSAADGCFPKPGGPPATAQPTIFPAGQ